MTDITPAPILGDTFKRRMTITPAVGTLVGTTIKLTIKRYHTDTTALLQGTTDNGKIVIIDAETIEVTFTALEMSALPSDVACVYDVEVTDALGAVFSKRRDTFLLVGDVTRS